MGSPEENYDHRHENDQAVRLATWPAHVLVISGATRRARGPRSFNASQIDQLVQHFDAYGYASLRGIFDEPVLMAAEEELAEAQRQLAEGMLDARHGTVILDEPDATIDGRPFAHYVCFATDASPRADGLVRDHAVVEVAERLLGSDAWLLDYEQFGVV